MFQVQEIDEQYLRGILIKGNFLINFGINKYSFLLVIAGNMFVFKYC